MGLAGYVLASMLILCAGDVPAAAQSKNAIQKKPAIPDAMLGSWGQDESDCVEVESDGRMHITPAAIGFPEHQLRITRILASRDGWWRIFGLTYETGKKPPQRAMIELRMKGHDGLILRNGQERPQDFIRCRPVKLQA